jgi:hypothetical protein
MRDRSLGRAHEQCSVIEGMKYPVFALVAVLALASCTKKEQTAPDDTVLMTKYNEPFDTMHHAQIADTVVVDSLAIHREQDEKKLHRFQPKEVVVIYDAYRPLRKSKPSEEEIEKFLREHKITRDELRAVLAEGDRLGWAK